MNKNGLLSVFTGNGKGKTTAALGLMFRAAGHGHRVCCIQFLKGSWECGEHKSVKKFDEQIDFHTLGKGFTWKSENLQEDIALAQSAWNFAEEIITENSYDMVVLDELTYLIKYEMVDENKIIDFLTKRPKDLHIIVTGRDASEKLIEIADLVTQMQEIKHPYTKGIKAQKGFEY